MGFLSGESKDDKQARKEAELLKKYGLSDMDEKDIESVKKIVSDLVGNGLLKTGMALNFAKAEEQAKVTYLSALVEQNWIMIRQLDRISKSLCSDQLNLNFVQSRTLDEQSSENECSEKEIWSCSNCGSINSNGIEICPNCGAMKD